MSSSRNKSVQSDAFDYDESFRTVFKEDQVVKLLINAQNGEILDANQAAAKFYGYPVSRLQQMNIKQINQLPSKKVSQEMMSAISKTKSKFFFQHKISNGDIKDVEVYSVPITIHGKQCLFSTIHDITDKNIAEKALLEREKTYRLLADNSMDIIWTADLKMNFTYVSKACESITGFSQKEWIGTNIRNHTSITETKKLIGIAKHLFKNNMSQNKSVIFETVLKRKDGAFVDVEVHGAFILDENGKPKLIQGITRDISKRKETEHKLKESEYQFKSMFENMLNGVALHQIVVNSKGKPVDYLFLDANSAFEQITGLKKKNIAGKKVSEVLPGIKNDSINWIEKYGSVTLKDKKIRFEAYSAELKKWFWISAFKLAENQFVSVFEDITQRKENEMEIKKIRDKLNSVIYHSKELFYIHDNNNRLTFVSPQSKSVLGYEPEELMKKWTDFVTDNPVNKKGIKSTQEAIRTGKRQETYILELRRKDGVKIVVEASESPIKDRSGKVIGITGALHDVTEKFKAEQERAQHIEELEKFHKFAIDREHKMIELKEQIRKLQKS